MRVASRGNDVPFRVMAGLGPATQDFAPLTQASRGWPAGAGHDT